MSIKAKDVIALLAQRHTRDVFFSEVKDGPTWGGAPMRLDALAIRKSWSPVSMFGYEVKVSRSDWLSDRKWEAYMANAHYFSIVAAPDVVKSGEIPAGVGWLVVSSTGASLRTMAKPARREIDPPWPLLLYLLMSRTEPSRSWAERATAREDRMESWRRILAEGKRIDYEVKGRIRERIEQLRGASKRAEEIAELEKWLDENDGKGWGTLTARVKSAVATRKHEIEAATYALDASVKRAAELLLKLSQGGAT